MAKTQTRFGTILTTAIKDGTVSGPNPCGIDGASSLRTGVEVEAPEAHEVAAIIKVISDVYKPLVAAAAGGGLRGGEATALTIDDVIVRYEGPMVDSVHLRVNKAVVHVVSEGKVLGTPKTAGSVRLVGVYGADAALIANHVATLPRVPGQLLWTSTSGGYLSRQTFQKHWVKAREAIEKPKLRFHSLRHFQGTNFARQGATAKELMDRLGHTNIKTAMRYQRSVQSRMDELARRGARI